MAALEGRRAREQPRAGTDALAKRWLHRDDDKIPHGREGAAGQGRWRDSPALAKLVAMREELRQLWTRTNVSAEQLVADLQAWCQQGRRQRHRRAAGVLAEAARRARLNACGGTIKKGPQCEPFLAPWPKQKGRACGPFACLADSAYFSLVSLYSTCLRAFGSNFMISSFSGVVFLFLSVV